MRNLKKFGKNKDVHFPEYEQLGLLLFLPILKTQYDVKDTTQPGRKEEKVYCGCKLKIMSCYAMQI